MNVIQGFQNADKEHGGFTFWCEGCKMRHLVYVRGENGGHPNWSWNGSLEKPTFAPSILVHYDHFKEDGPPLKPGEHYNMHTVCHSFVNDGMIQYLGDCTHALANQTVALLPINDKGDFDEEDD